MESQQCYQEEQQKFSSMKFSPVPRVENRVKTVERQRKIKCLNDLQSHNENSRGDKEKKMLFRLCSGVNYIHHLIQSSLTRVFFTLPPIHFYDYSLEIIINTYNRRVISQFYDYMLLTMILGNLRGC
jgi:hypothetical protein